MKVEKEPNELDIDNYIVNPNLDTLWSSDLKTSPVRPLSTILPLEIDIPVAQSAAVYSNDALEAQAADKIGYPVILRSAFKLRVGGLSWFRLCQQFGWITVCLQSLSPSSLVSSIERSMKGFKELEYEVVVRDAADVLGVFFFPRKYAIPHIILYHFVEHIISSCRIIEDFDLLGTHTVTASGDSIVIAPSQTYLTSAALKVIRHLVVINEWNTQYELSSTSKEYCVIEVNASSLDSRKWNVFFSKSRFETE